MRSLRRINLVGLNRRDVVGYGDCMSGGVPVKRRTLKKLAAIGFEACRTASCKTWAMHFCLMLRTGNCRRRSRTRARSCLLSEA